MYTDVTKIPKNTNLSTFEPCISVTGRDFLEKIVVSAVRTHGYLRVKFQEKFDSRLKPLPLSVVRKKRKSKTNKTVRKAVLSIFSISEAVIKSLFSDSEGDEDNQANAQGESFRKFKNESHVN